MAFEKVTISDEQKASLEEKHEDILLMRGDEEMSPWLVVVRRPTRQEIKAYKTHLTKDATSASEMLVSRLCVYPTQDEFNRQVDRWPLLVDAVMADDKFKSFVGVSTNASLK